MGGADNQAPACRTDNERSRADALSQARFFETMKFFIIKSLLDRLLRKV